MKNIVFVGGHLGFPMDSTPLGGGAMVGLQMARHWAHDDRFKLAIVGAGPESPEKSLSYHRLAGVDNLVSLSEFEYARFCRTFEREATQFIADHRTDFPIGETCIILNDISEGPDVARISALGYPIVSIWHVDVVDFFNKMYLNNILAPECLTAAFDRLERCRAGWLVPDLLKLVFRKQRDTVRHATRLVFPSTGMAKTVKRCYPAVPEKNLEILPWGGWQAPVSEASVRREVERLKAYYQIAPDTRVMMTLSRISPEKGLLLLLQALSDLEKADRFPARDACVFICGEAAFMQGKPYDRQVRAAAQRLKKFRIFFPGYLSSADKQAYFGLADLFISPSIHESYGLSIVEAMQAGLPILASDHSGVEEILAPEFSRVVVYNGQAGGLASWFGKGGSIPRQLAVEISDLLRNHDALRGMGRRAQEASKSMAFANAARRLSDIALSLVS